MDDQTPRQPQFQPVSEQPLPTPMPPSSQSLPQLDVEPATSSPTPIQTPSPLSGDPIFIPPFTQPVVPKKSKKRLFITLAAMFILLVGGGASVYAFWYQNPEKVVTDGVLHALQAKSIEYTGSISTDIASNKSKFEITGADVSDAHRVSVKMTMSDPFTGKELPVEGEGLFDAKSDLYVKIKNIDDVVAPYRDLFSKKTQQSFDKIVAKINDKWVKISATDLAGLGQTASKTQTCVGEVIKKYANDSAAISEITEVYKRNRFIVVDQNLGTKDGSLGYTMKTDEAKAKAFAEAVKMTKIYTALHECDNNFTISSNDLTIASDSRQTTHAEIWVSQWTHQITRVTTSSSFSLEEDSSTEKTETLFEPKFNTGVTISAPEASITLSELRADVEKLFKDAEAEYTDGLQSKA